MFLLIVFVFLSIIVLGVPSWLEVIVDVAWDVLHTYFPSSWQTLTSYEVWDKIWDWYLNEPWVVWIVVAWNAFSMVGGMICAYMMLTFRNVLGAMLFWMNCVVLAAGVAFVICCYVLVPVVPTSWLGGLFLAGCLTIVSGAVGIFTCRQRNVIVGWISYTAVTFACMVIVGSFLLTSVEENSRRVANLTALQLGEVVERLEFIAMDWTEESLKTFLDSNLVAAAAAQLIVALIILGTMGASLLVLKDIDDAAAEYAATQAGHKQARDDKEWQRSKTAGEWMEWR